MIINRNHVQSDLLAYIREKKTEVTIRELGEWSGISRNTLAKYLEVLVQRGEVEEKKIGTAKLYSISQRVPGDLMLRVTSDPACIILPDLTVASCNSLFEEIIAGNDQTSLHRPLDRMMPDIRSDLLISSVSAALGGDQREVKQPVQVRGRKYLFMLKFIPVFLSTGEYGCGILFHDESGIQVLHTSLQESEGRYRAIIDDQLDLVCRRRPDLSLSYVNRAYCDAARRSSADLLEKQLFPFVLSHNSLETRSVYRQITPERPLIETETRDVSQNGQVNWLQWIVRGIFSPEGGIIEYQAIGRDITPLKRCEEQIRVFQRSLEFLVQDRTKELQDANQKLIEELIKREKNEILLIERELWFKALFNNISEPCILFEQTEGRRPGRIIEANESACLALQYSKEELLSMNSADITSEEHWNEYVQNYYQKLAENQILTYPGEGRRKDGQIFPVEISSHRFTLQKNPVVLIICRDLSPDTAGSARIT